MERRERIARWPRRWHQGNVCASEEAAALLIGQSEALSALSAVFLLPCLALFACLQPAMPPDTFRHLSNLVGTTLSGARTSYMVPCKLVPCKLPMLAVQPCGEVLIIARLRCEYRE